MLLKDFLNILTLTLFCYKRVLSFDRACGDPVGTDCVVYNDCPYIIDYLKDLSRPFSKDTFEIVQTYMCGILVESKPHETVHIPKFCCYSPLHPQSNSSNSGNKSDEEFDPFEADSENVLWDFLDQVDAFYPSFDDSLEETEISDMDMEDYSLHPNFHLLPHDRCGKVENFARRITHGTHAKPSEFPWMALLFYYTDENSIDTECSGSLINERYLLTAAHCCLVHEEGLIVKRKSLIGVRLGDHDMAKLKEDCVSGYCPPPPQDIFIEKIIVHPEYNDDTMLYDIALIKLSVPARFTSSVQPICLPLVEPDLQGQFLTIAGWGITENGKRSKILTRARVPVIPHEKCQRLFRRVPVTEYHLCAGGYRRRDSCRGDSGGPLSALVNVYGILRYVQYGIISYGTRTCNKPAVYTRVAKLMEWILDNIDG